MKINVTKVINPKKNRSNQLFRLYNINNIKRNKKEKSQEKQNSIPFIISKIVNFEEKNPFELTSIQNRKSENSVAQQNNYFNQTNINLNFFLNSKRIKRKTHNFLKNVISSFPTEDALTYNNAQKYFKANKRNGRIKFDNGFIMKGENKLINTFQKANQRNWQSNSLAQDSAYESLDSYKNIEYQPFKNEFINPFFKVVKQVRTNDEEYDKYLKTIIFRKKHGQNINSNISEIITEANLENVISNNSFSNTIENLTDQNYIKNDPHTNKHLYIKSNFPLFSKRKADEKNICSKSAERNKFSNNNKYLNSRESIFTKNSNIPSNLSSIIYDKR